MRIRDLFSRIRDLFSTTNYETKKTMGAPAPAAPASLAPMMILMVSYPIMTESKNCPYISNLLYSFLMVDA